MTSTTTGSIVCFHNPYAIVKRAARSFLASHNVHKLFIVDNSADEALSKLRELDPRIVYIFLGENVGFGAAHNIAIKRSLDAAHYHVVLNPDVHFSAVDFDAMLAYMDEHPDIGLLMPKVLYPDGSTQYLCKLLPTPADLLFRRFLPLRSVVERMDRRYELRFTGYDSIMDVPYLSGCFMLLRTDTLKSSGAFDERFFMYLEDTDLSRRIHEISRTVFFPHAKIYHEFAKGSYGNPRLLKYHIMAAIRYFNKWGWLFDQTRRRVNTAALAALNNRPPSR